MSYSSIWAVRPRNILYNGSSFNDGNFPSSDIKYTWAGPINSKLYSESLNSLSKETEANITRLEKNRSAQKTIYYAAPDQPTVQSSWADYRNMFTPKSKIKKQFELDDDCSTTSSVTGASNFCYLCSTLDEHQLHLKYPKKSKPHQPPRVKYIAPPPKVSTKQIEEHPQYNFDNMYKVVVWTGNEPECSTDARVFITIKGDKNVLYKERLCRGSKKKKFCFSQGSREIFYVKSPTLGNLDYITIEHDGEEKRHSWFCEKVEITCMKTGIKWLFRCHKWLSRHHDDFLTSRDLKANTVKEQEYILSVETGSKRLAGTDARVFVTFYGTEGKSTKIELTANRNLITNEKLFQRNQTNEFRIKFHDIGEIKTLRIEHDGSGLASGWYLNKAELYNSQDADDKYFFVLNGWLSRDVGDGLLWREIKAKRKLAPEITRGEKVKYQIIIRTGNVRFAGTDANVYIIIQGNKGKTKKFILDDAKNNFEQGMTDDFTIEAFNTGTITSIYIGHDNSGPGAGWFCEDVTVKKYLTTKEKKKYKSNSRPIDKHEKKTRSRSSTRLRAEESGESEDSESEDSSKYDEDGKPGKIPLYEEYYFECKSWIALDEKDGLLERELHPKKISIHYEERK